MMRARTTVFGLAAALVMMLPSQGFAAPLQGNATFDKALWFSGSYADQTVAAGDATTNDTTIASASSADYSYWGLQSPSDAMYFLMGTWGTSGTAAYAYSSPVTVLNLDGFSTLSLTANPSSDFTVPSGDGTTSISFTPPSNWTKSTINGTNAYWVRIGANTPYSTLPKATTAMARAYNLRVKLQNDAGTAYSANITPSLSNCGSNVYLGEWNTGSGIHNYALRTDAGNCTLSFSSTGYVDTSFTATGLTTSLNDMSGTPKSLVRDELMTITASGGGAVNGATVTFYTNAGYTQEADDLSVSGANDAHATTDSSGQVKFALAGGTYYYKVMGSGYADATGSVLINSGSANSQGVTLATSPIDTTISASQSFVGVVPSTIMADNVQTGTITVVARNAANVGLSGKVVTVSANFGAAVISPAQATTDGSGTATFTIKSGTVGAATLTAVAGGVTLNTHPVAQFVSSAGCAYATGQLVKLPSDGNNNTQEDSAVYYYGKDCKRHAFPNDKVYFSWYSNFNSVANISSATLASMPLGANVNYRPGVKMVKFTTVPKTYAVSRYGILRWITSESVATQLYGSAWNTHVDDISDAFYTNYAFGADITNSNQYSPQNEMNAAPTIDDNL
ncbi:MAG: Ig-like domain-containing protein [Patescibacteria group bacterium]